MSDDASEIVGLDIKPYISSQMNCRTSAAGYVMEPVNSNLILDFSSFSEIIKATIIFSRINGNGKVKVNNICTDVLSKTFHQIDLDILENKKIEFSRGNDSIGKIIINKVIIVNVESVIEKLAKKELQTNKLRIYNENWKSNFIKLGNVRGIKYINNKIYAQEGAQILHSNIIEFIETEPPKCFVILDVIKFIYPCEITSVYFKQEFETNIEGKYHHFKAPPQLQSNNSHSNNTINTEDNMTLPQNNIIYDSYISKFDIGLLNNAKEIVPNYGNNNGILLKREAEFYIPLSNLKSHTQYNIVARLKKITGNGKFGVAIGITNGEIRSSTVLIAPDRETDVYIKLNTDDEPVIGSSYMLKIFRPEDSTVGDVLLERLQITQGLNLHGSQVSKETKIGLNTRVYDSDYVLNNSKKHSRSVSWFNKVKLIYPNFNTTEFCKISFANLGALVNADKIWVNSFDGDVISEKDNLILSEAKMLISSCPANIDFFKKSYPNVESHLLEKVWPLITTIDLKYPSGDYAVMLHRSSSITDKIVELYDSANNPPLVIIGAIKNYPDFVISINEYLPYDKILSVILNSKFIIDIPKFINYVSGFLSLVIDEGIPVITSNKFYLNNDNVLYLSKIEDINFEINKCLKLEKTSRSENHNDKVQNILSTILKE